MQYLPSKKTLALTAAVCGLALGGRATRAHAADTYFRDLSGVNANVHGLGPYGGLNDNAISHGRAQLSWSSVQPRENGGFKEDVIDDWITNHVKQNNFYGGDTVAGLGYTVGWAADTSEKSYDFQGYHFQITNNNGQLHLSGGPRPRDLDSTNKLPPTLDHVKDWKNYVSHVATRLHQAGVEYFQPWNEANGWGFYIGDMDLNAGESDAQDDGYYYRIHKPAADAIHAAGGKVVYGGWPTPKTITDYATWLNYHTTADPNDKLDAWDNIDVLDMHYRDLSAMEYMRQQAVKAGHPDIGIWQTEEGNNRFEEYIPSFYPRFAKWALLHNDGDPDRYRIYYYPYQGGAKNNDSNGNNKLLIFTGGGHNHELTENGIALKTIGTLLSGPNGDQPLKLYNHVSNDQGLTFNLHTVNYKDGTTAGTSSIESFKIGDRIVVALHLDDTKTHGDMTLTFDDLDPDDVGSAFRITPYGDKIDLLDTLKDLGEDGISFVVPTDNIRLPAGGTLNSTEHNPRSFFVQLGLVPEPSSLALLGLGGLAMFSRRRRRSMPTAAATPSSVDAKTPTPRRHVGRSGTRQGFTLIELLVVISIIA